MSEGICYEKKMFIVYTDEIYICKKKKKVFRKLKINT